MTIPASEAAGILYATGPASASSPHKITHCNHIELMQTVPELADLPVIFISGYGRDETIARALEAGADDYVVKPFSPTELTARIRAALRRRANPVPFVLGDLAIDYDRRRVSVAGRPVTLTPTEYELLRVLAQGAGRILTHEALLRLVWAGRGHGKANPKIVRAYVKRLRHRLGDDAARPAWIRQRARGRLPYGPPRRAGRALTAGLSCGIPSRPERPLSPIRMCRKRPFATRRRGRRQTRAAVCRIPCLILCLANVEHVGWLPCAERAAVVNAGAADHVP